MSKQRPKSTRRSTHVRDDHIAVIDHEEVEDGCTLGVPEYAWPLGYSSYELLRVCAIDDVNLSCPGCPESQVYDLMRPVSISARRVEAPDLCSRAPQRCSEIQSRGCVASGEGVLTQCSAVYCSVSTPLCLRITFLCCARHVGIILRPAEYS